MLMTTKEQPVVYVVDDDPSVCASIKRLLRSAGQRAMTFTSTADVFPHGRPDGPCCLVLDVRLAGEDGLEFQDALARDGIGVPIIFVSGHGDIPTAVRAINHGAVDFLTKPFDSDQLLNQVRRALEADEASLAERVHLTELRQRYRTLTPREQEVFAAVATGMLNKQVAFDLGITEKTVKVHRARVMEKMGAVSVADLVRIVDLLVVRCPERGGALGARCSGERLDSDAEGVADAWAPCQGCPLHSCCATS